MAERPCDAHGNVSSRQFKGAGHFERQFQTEEGVTHQPLLVSGN